MSTEAEQPALDETGATSAREDAANLLTRARALQRPDPGSLKPAERLRWFAAMDQATKDAHSASDALKALRNAAYEDVMAALDAMGLARAPLENGPTIYRARELWAGYAFPDDATDEQKADLKERANEALRDAGLDEYVVEGFNTQSLSGYFRDRERELEDEARERDGLPATAPVAIDPGDLLPDELKGLVKITEKVYPKAKTS